MKSLIQLALPALCSLSLLMPSALATPVLANPTRRDALANIDAKLLERFNVYAHYSASGYCKENLHPTPAFHQIACTQFGGKCPFVEMRNPNIIGAFQDNTTFAAGGYVSTDA